MAANTFPFPAMYSTMAGHTADLGKGTKEDLYNKNKIKYKFKAIY